MDESGQTLPKLELPNRIRRELRKGETIYHSTLPCHVSQRFPQGKWIAQTRREEKGTLIKYPVKGFGSVGEALDYLRSLRPDERGKVYGGLYAVSQGESTVRDLFEYVKAHRQKRIGAKTKDSKESRWELYIAPEWADCPLSKVSSRAAQEWISGLELEISEGRAGSLGLPQLDKIRTDLSSLFNALPSFSPVYEDRRNPFAGLEYTPAPPRVKTTLESQFFAPLFYICPRMAADGFCTTWVAEMFLTSLLSGLRFGEVMGLCRDQLDFKHGAIVVDRAMRRSSRAIDPKTRVEVGPVLRAAMNHPKGASYANPRTRVVPLSDHLASILKIVVERPSVKGAEWELLWPAESGRFKEAARFTTAWTTLRARLQELATLAPVGHEGRWPEIPKHQGLALNPLIHELRRKPKLRIPAIFQQIDFRDTRSSFGSYLNEINLSQATREHLLGHGGGNLTNSVYTEITSKTFKDASKRITVGWTPYTS